jgi:hypothetical protein
LLESAQRRRFLDWHCQNSNRGERRNETTPKKYRNRTNEAVQFGGDQ